VRYATTRAEAELLQAPGDTARVLTLFDDARGCEKLAQRLLVFEPGRSRARLEPRDDEVLYVLGGRGRLDASGTVYELAGGTGVYLRRNTSWSVESDERLETVWVALSAAALEGYALLAFLNAYVP